MSAAVSLVECPRDAFQGLPRFIPTEVKVRHLRLVAAAGAAEIDFGSFVSPRAVPQMADTEDVLARLLADSAGPLPRLIAIIGNERGLDRAAAAFGPWRGHVWLGAARPVVGYPLSLAETFQRNNTGLSIADSWPLVETLTRRAEAAGLELIVYLSMSFGNPYGERWSPGLVAEAAERLTNLGVRIISLADTVGLGQPAQVRETFHAVHAAVGAGAGAAAADRPTVVGAHFHAAPGRWLENVEAAFAAGCRRFDTSLGGYGGCPFAQDELVGNIPTEQVVAHFGRAGIPTGVDSTRLAAAVDSARHIFREYGGNP